MEDRFSVQKPCFRNHRKILAVKGIFATFLNLTISMIFVPSSPCNTDFLFFFERTREYYNFWDFELTRATRTDLTTGKRDFSDFWGILLSSPKACFWGLRWSIRSSKNEVPITRKNIFSANRFSATSLGSLREGNLGLWFPVILEHVKLKLSFSGCHIQGFHYNVE